MKQKLCSRCGFQGDSDLFRTGRNICLECQSSYTKKWYKKNWDSVKSTEKKKRVKKYGITVEEYDQLIVNQNNKCKICEESFLDNAPTIDHCHETKLVRGILCHSCNIGLGLFKDNEKSLGKAMEYLNAKDKFIGNRIVKEPRRVF